MKNGQNESQQNQIKVSMFACTCTSKAPTINIHVNGKLVTSLQQPCFNHVNNLIIGLSLLSI